MHYDLYADEESAVPFCVLLVLLLLSY